MRYLWWIVFAGVVLLGTDAGAEDGKSLFKSLHCVTCHKAHTGRFNPSLSEIAWAYQGRESQLDSYLSGEAESVVRPEKGEMMKRYIKRTKALSDEQRKSLAEFILSHHD